MKNPILSTFLISGLLFGVAFAAEPKSTFIIAATHPFSGKNYNPYTGSANHLAPTVSAIYESLFYISPRDGKVNWILGTKYVWSKDNKTLTITTRPGVKWTDGQAFDAKDVAFSFNFIKANPALDLTGIWKSGVSSVKAPKANTVVISFDKVNVPFLYYIGNLPIVPEHIWKGVKDPVTFTNENPVGTGPFIAESYSPQALRVLKNPKYWMKDRPYVDAVAWMATNGNDAALMMLLKDKADYSFNAVSDPDKHYKAKGPNNDYWWPAFNANFLYFNTLKAPFNDVAFRRAIAGALDTKVITQKAYAGAVPVTDNSGMALGQVKQWKPAAANVLGVKFDTSAADKALSAAGYKKNSAGQRLGKDGKPLPAFKILVGSGWTDFITMAQVIGEQLKPLGISTSIDQQVYSSYAGSFQTANFDMGVSWGWGYGPTPYYLYNQAFSPDYSAPAGKTASSNLSHFTDPQLTKALNAFAATSDPVQQKKLMGTIVTTVMKNQPWVPLTARVGFNVYNRARFSGFADESNPYYEGNSDETTGARFMLINVKPK